MSEATNGEGRIQLATGVTISYRERGESGAPPVVLLHPWLESGDAFSLMMPHLGDLGLRLLILDQRGAGKSEKPPAGYELSSLARDVVAFLDALGIPSTILVGASSGGYVAQEVAASHPGRVSGLVLAGAPRSLHGRTPPFAAELDHLIDPIDPAWAMSFVSDFVPRGLVQADFIAARVRDALAVPAWLWRESLEAFIRSEPPASENINAPTLIVRGGRDKLLDGDSIELVAAIRGARLIEYPDTGHLIHWEQPERLAEDVATFAVSVFGGS